jgi:hypothetical protein
VARPSYDEATLAQYFMPMSEDLFDDPVAGPALRRLAADDPDLIAAVADVDRSQIRDCARQSPIERLRSASRRWNGLMRFRRSG